MKILGISLAIIFAFIFQGCAPLGHKTFYHQQSPSTYPETNNVLVFEYQNIDIDQIQKILFDDYLIIGKSSFVGPYEEARNASSFAQSIGTDILITNTQFKETKTSVVPLTMPTTTTTFVNTGASAFTMTSYGTQTIAMPITVRRYNQQGIFLKNINHIVPVWEKTKKDYAEGNVSQLDGVWENDRYILNISQSKDNIVAFISLNKNTDRSNFWKKDDLKFIFGVYSGKGIYLMGDKTPVPSIFTINKFGHLEIKLLTTEEVFSFKKL
jgi:hypothetical protein